MRNRDHATKAAAPRVLTDAEVDTLSARQLRKLVREGLAVLPSQQPGELEKLIEEELTSVRPKKRQAHRLGKSEIN